MNKDYRPEDEINYGNLLKSPRILIGILAPFVILAIIFGAIYMTFSLTWSSKNPIKPVALTRDTVPLPLVMQKGNVVEGVDIKKISVSNDEYVQKGAELYKSNCTSCHGESGKGDGVAGKALKPPARDFTAIDGWTNGRKFSEMWKTLEEGVPSTGMISYNFLSIEDRVYLIHYIHSLMSDVPKDTDADLANLDINYKLSEPKVTPNQVPVPMALKALLNENQSINEKIVTIEKNLTSNVDEPATKILANNTNNLRKVVITLLKSNDWKNSQNNFLKELESNINNNGFKTSALRLSNNELQLLYSFLLKNFA